MRIDSSAINFTSSHSLTKKYEKTEELRMWVGERDPQSLQDAQQLRDRLTLSNDARNDLLKNPEASDIKKEDDDLSGEDGSLMFTRLVIEAFTGKKIHIKNFMKTGDNAEAVKPKEEKENSDGQQPAREGWGVIYNSSESYYEHEQMSFTAEGVVKTSDGKEIQFSLELNMEREYVHTESVNVRAGDAALVDPLVINYAGPAAELTSSKFTFDLNADGETEDISFAGSGSGLLALDLNNDGVVNNGKELFGPQTGNGFGELAAYDLDSNNWIDENDTVFDQLRIWTKDAEGNDYLNTLKERGVGAIYLANITSPLSLKDAENNLLGQIDTTGVYLKEDGTAGTVQQVNLVA